MLDDLMPIYEFVERHHRRIEAPAAQTWAALTTLTLKDLTITRPLIAIRRGKSSETLDRPLLTDGPVTLLHRQDGRLAIAGAIARPWKPKTPKQPLTTLEHFTAFADPGWTKYLTEFRVDPEAGHARCVLTTETRGLSTDKHARRCFRLYWTLIRLPSGLIRQDILRAVDRAVTHTRDDAYVPAMKAIAVEPETELETFAGQQLEWRYAVRVSASGPSDALTWARATFEQAPSGCAYSWWQAGQRCCWRAAPGPTPPTSWDGPSHMPLRARRY